MIHWWYWSVYLVQDVFFASKIENLCDLSYWFHKTCYLLFSFSMMLCQDRLAYYPSRSLLASYSINDSSQEVLFLGILLYMGSLSLLISGSGALSLFFGCICRWISVSPKLSFFPQVMLHVGTLPCKCSLCTV